MMHDVRSEELQVFSRRSLFFILYVHFGDDCAEIDSFLLGCSDHVGHDARKNDNGSHANYILVAQRIEMLLAQLLHRIDYCSCCYCYCC